MELRASTEEMVPTSIICLQFTAENKAVSLSWNTVTMVGLHKDQLTPNFAQLLCAPKPPQDLFHTEDINTEGNLNQKNLQGTHETKVMTRQHYLPVALWQQLSMADGRAVYQQPEL